ncbi:MAG: hypothetical protein KKF48_05020 [Nanoarchaeota archaeon]|nr:hypothetical protein [Nanoarchaeota archaeon]MBU1028379.1 hypothetical protein [Nanoarchaeota archaeon]
MKKGEKKLGTRSWILELVRKGLSKSKLSQVTIFIIIALVLIGLVIIFLFFRDIVPPVLGGTRAEINPSQYMESCLEENLKEAVDKISLQGGSLSPSHYVLYDNSRIEYLCYTNEYHVLCVVQQPLLVQHIETEIENSIDSKARECLNSMKSNYENSGYQVNLRPGKINVELIPKRILINFNNSLTLTKEGSKTYDSIKVVLNNNLYELVSIANSILRWETNYGDAETTTYMDYYPDLKVEKKKQSEGSTIYILTDRNNLNKFQFASRSVAWPPGYG